MYKIKILVIAEAVSMAHPTRMWELINNFDLNAYEIHFATSDTYFKLLERKEFIQCHRLNTIPNRVFNERLFKTEFPYTLNELIEFSKADESLIFKTKPDIIISDFRLSAYNIAKKLNIPFINLIQYHWYFEQERKSIIPYVQLVDFFGRGIVQFFQPMITPFILSRQLKIVNAFQLHCNQKPYNNIFDFYSDGDYVVFPDLPSLFPNAQPTSRQKFIGPLIWKNSQMEWPQGWTKNFSHLKTAYVTMGSTGSHKVVPKVIVALRKKNYQVLISSSGVQYRNEPRDSVFISPFVPADEVISRSDLVICNGGTSTTYHCIAREKPIIAIPTNLEQYLHVNQLKKKHLAESENPDNFDAEQFIEKVEQLEKSNETKSQMALMAKEIERIREENPMDKLVKEIMK